MAQANIVITVPLNDAPDWLEGLILTNYEGSLRIEVVKASGSDYGHVDVAPQQLLAWMKALNLEIPS